MNQDRLNDIKKNLWEVADELRANSGLKASAYSIPVLGLIFLKFADAKYTQHEDEIMQEYEALKGGRREKKVEEIAIEKCGFYLPEKSRYSYLLSLSEEENIANKIKEAMEGIEEYSPEFVGVLPKDNYHNLTRLLINQI